MFLLHVDSRWELHPGLWVTYRATIAHPQTPILELDPPGRGGHHDVCPKVPYTHTLIQSLWQCAASLTYLAVHTRGTPPLVESAELAKCCGACPQVCPIQRKCGDSGALLHEHVGLPHQEKVQS